MSNFYGEQKSVLFLIFLLLLVSGITLNCAAHPEDFMISKKGTLKTIDGKYLLYLPKTTLEPEKKWPLIYFLHGMGERGNDLTVLLPHLPPMIFKETADFPFILIAPQLSLRKKRWSNKKLNRLLNDVIAKFPVDENRIYLTGYSMGGYGTWNLAMDYPDKFAAIAPICGGGDPNQADKIAHIPAWVVHGAQDDVVPFSESEAMVNAVKKHGGTVEFVVFPEMGHGGWSETYGNPEFFNWLLEQHKQ